MGKIEVKPPSPAALVETAGWGEVPANQICVILAEGKNRADANQIARSLGGTVVGELEFLNAYQIETTATTEADLRASLDQAGSMPGVELAFPNQQVFPAQEI